MSRVLCLSTRLRSAAFKQPSVSPSRCPPSRNHRQLYQQHQSSLAISVENTNATNEYIGSHYNDEVMSAKSQEHKMCANAREDAFKHFYMSAALRSMKRGDYVAPSLQNSTNLPTEETTVNTPKKDNVVERMMIQSRIRAREDASEHFHMNSAFRAMKRGDYAMDVALLDPDKPPKVASVDTPKENNTIEMEEARIRTLAREDAYKHFHMSANLRSIKRTDSFASLQEFSEAREYRRTTIPSSYKTHHHSADLLHEHKVPLPTTIDEAYKEFFRKNFFYDKQRPMVITEASPPFHIVDVNKAWTQLCGYTRNEAVGRTLKELLHGQETNATVARDLTASLLQSIDANGNESSTSSKEYEAVLTNYRSDGQKFKNHVRVGKLKNDDGDIYFVGVFRKLSDNIYDLYTNM